jgi:hypothetical protein
MQRTSVACVICSSLSKMGSSGSESVSESIEQKADADSDTDPGTRTITRNTIVTRSGVPALERLPGLQAMRVKFETRYVLVHQIIWIY